MDFSFIPTVMAQWAPLLDASASYSTSDMLRIAISFIVFAAGICAIGFIIWWGLMLVLSGGDDGKVKTAVGMIRYSIVGIIVIVVAIFVVPKITEMLNLGTFNISPRSVFDTVQQLSQKMFGGGSTPTYHSSSSVDFTDL